MASLAQDISCKRKRIRIQYMAAVELSTAEGRRIRGNLRDIGIDSIYVKTEQDVFELVDLAEVDIVMTITRGGSSLTIRTQGQVIRSDSEGCAVQFLEPLKWWPVFSHFPINDDFMFDLVSAT